MQGDYYRSEYGNFGDDLNAWIWRELIPNAYSAADDTILVGIGTIINRKANHAFPRARTWMALGSGAGYGSPPADFGGDAWRYIKVRGPLSARVLGLDDSHAGTDGAILLATLPAYQPLPEEARHGAVFMPHHHATDRALWRDACALAGVDYLDPAWDSHVILDRLRSAKVVLADAMHAAITADTLRVPWTPLVSSPQISTFKWMDWALSMDAPYEPTFLPPISPLAEARDEMLSWYGEHYQFAPATRDAALADFAERQKGPKGRLARWSRTGATFAAKALSGPAADRKRASALKAGVSDYVKRAAEALVAAQTAPRFLSPDNRFLDRLTVMREGLDRVAAIAREADSSSVSGR